MAIGNPFPGMDPWLEHHWEAVHHSYMQYTRDQVAAQLPDGLFSEVEETVYIADVGPDWLPSNRVRPDVGVFGTPQPGLPVGTDDLPEVAGGGRMAVATPVRVPISDEPRALTHVVIRSLARGEPLVTAIEVISPTNKSDPRARRRYRRKRRAYYDARANVVEIDLLRAGRPVVDVPWDRVSAELLTPYRAAVRRGADPDVPDVEAEYYPMPLRERLPIIRVPLRVGDADLALDLQRPVDQAYARGRYDLRLDYATPPRPPLSPDDAAWAAERVAAAR